MKKLINFVADHIDIGHGPIGCWAGIITIVGFQRYAYRQSFQESKALPAFVSYCLSRRLTGFSSWQKSKSL